MRTGFLAAIATVVFVSSGPLSGAAAAQAPNQVKTSQLVADANKKNPAEADASIAKDEAKAAKTNAVTAKNAAKTSKAKAAADKAAKQADVAASTAAAAAKEAANR